MAVSDWVPATIRKAGIERRLAAGDSLFRQGERTAGLYEVIKGRLRLARPNLDGSEIVLYIAAAGETIAEASLFSPTYHCDAIAVTDAVVRLYPKAPMLAEFQRSPEAAKKYMAMLAGEVMSRALNPPLPCLPHPIYPPYTFGRFLSSAISAPPTTAFVITWSSMPGQMGARFNYEARLKNSRLNWDLRMKSFTGFFPSLQPMARLSDGKGGLSGSQKSRLHDPDHMRSRYSAVIGF